MALTCREPDGVVRRALGPLSRRWIWAICWAEVPCTCRKPSGCGVTRQRSLRLSPPDPKVQVLRSPELVSGASTRAAEKAIPLLSEQNCTCRRAVQDQQDP